MDFFVKLRKTVMFCVKAMIVIVATTGFTQTWNSNYVESLFSNRGNYVVIFSYVLIFSVFSSLYGAFKIGVYRIHEIIYSFSLAVVFTNMIMYLELSLIARDMVAVRPMIFGVIYQIGAVALSAMCANVIYFKLYKARKVVAIFGDDVAAFEIINKMSRISDRFNITCGLNVNTSSLEIIYKNIDKNEAVLLCVENKNLQKEILSYCYRTEKRAYILPDFTDIIINNSYEIQISDTPVLMSRNRGLTPEQAFIKRVIDIFVSGVGLIIASPFMLISAIAIKLDDGGPILFKQNRITKDGKIFNIYKFRSMIVDADKDGARKAETDDDRITRVGKVIRACRIDELPQLINVLKGDMSIVGPRPERIENVYEYTNKYPQFELRHKVKAGITGFAQLYGKYNTTPEDKLNMDLIYIETYSLLQDIKLMVLTFKVLFMKESTEGFDHKANANVQTSKSIKEKEEK
ncbi:MAG: sugar transferase [Clostridia bacterium]|nr:sugar transferase [Clostridia bacterium]